MTSPQGRTQGRKQGRPRRSAREGGEDRPPARRGSVETELKLAGTPDALESLWASKVGPGAQGACRRLISTYFDTADHRLRRQGFTLRVRQDGKSYVQTLKAARVTAAGLARRMEWSTPLEGPAPDLGRVNDPEALERIGLVVAGELQPLFTTDVSRHAKTYRIGPGAPEGPNCGPHGDPHGDSHGAPGPNGTAGGARIEAAWDRGEVISNGQREAICELELELLEGSAAALQREAVRLLDATPLEYQPLSKAERGFALAAGERPTFRKAELPRLGAETSVEAGLERILSNCVNHWLANHAAVLDGSDPEGLHQMRIALRRLRSALTIFKGVLSADDRAWLNGEAQALIGDLGGARDWDVFADEMLAPVLAARPQDGRLKTLRDAVGDQRRLAYERAWATLRSPRYLRFVLELGVWLESRGWRRGQRRGGLLDRRLVELADDVLHKRHRKAIKLGRNFDGLTDEALHRLRISLKKLRYATEFFATLYGKGRTRAYLGTLRQMQDDLGYLNDVAVAEAGLAELCGGADDDAAGALALPCGTVVGWHSHALDRIRPRIARDWHAFAGSRPFWHEKGAASQS